MAKVKAVEPEMVTMSAADAAELRKKAAERDDFARLGNQQGEKLNRLEQQMTQIVGRLDAPAQAPEPAPEPEFEAPGLNDGFEQLMREMGGGVPGADGGQNQYALLQQIQELHNRLGKIEERQPAIDQFYDDYTAFRGDVEGRFGGFSQRDFQDSVSYALEDAGISPKAPDGKPNRFFNIALRDVLDAKGQAGDGVFDLPTVVAQTKERYQDVMDWQTQTHEQAATDAETQETAGDEVPVTGAPAESTSGTETTSPGAGYSSDVDAMTSDLEEAYKQE